MNPKRRGGCPKLAPGSWWRGAYILVRVLPNMYTVATSRLQGRNACGPCHTVLRGVARMPKLARSRVAWSGTQQRYQIEEHGRHAPLAIAPDSSAWFAWLDQLSSFAFRGRVAHYTARKEQ